MKRLEKNFKKHRNTIEAFGCGCKCPCLCYCVATWNVQQASNRDRESNSANIYDGMR